MLFLKTIEVQTLSLLKRLQALPELADTRLVGGTALALQLGHRVSVDLDIFGKWDYTLDLHRILSTVGKVEKVNSTPDGRMAFFFIDDVKVDCVSYEMYKWLEPPIEEDEVRLAGIKDIAAMKINAITNRGARKDFVDIARLLDEHSLKEMLEWYRQKYPEANPALALRSLCFFADAETMPMPRMMIAFDWSDVKEKIQSAVRAFICGAQQGNARPVGRDRGRHMHLDTNRTSGTSTTPQMEFVCKGASLNARGLTGPGLPFIVLQNSVVSSSMALSLRTHTPGYHKLRCRLENDGTIVNGVFARDCAFNSPSAAASVVTGRPSNGRLVWIAADGRSLKEVQEEWQV